MGKIINAELVLRGHDRTAAAFAGVIRHAEETRAALRGIDNMPFDDAKIRQANAALRQRTTQLRAERLAVTELARSERAVNEALAARVGLLSRMRTTYQGIASMSGVGWMMGGLASGRLAHAVGHDTAEFQHQRAMLSSTTGMTPAEVKRATDAAMAMRVAGMSATDNLRAIGELRMVFGSTREAIENAAAVQRAAALLKAVNPQANAHDESYNLARTLELKGVSMDPAHFMRLNNMLLQAILASRGKVSAEGFLSFAQRAGSGTIRSLSDEFFSRVAPTLIQEMHGDTAGRALATLENSLVGGHMKLTSAAEWMRLGLLDPKKVEYSKIGTIKRVHPGALVASELFVRDPYAWMQKYLRPALKRAGITGKDALSVEMAALFSDRYSKNMATILLTQRQRIEKDYGLIDNTPGVEALPKVRSSDPPTAVRDLGAAIDSLLSAFGSPFAGLAIKAMNELADGARNLASGFADMAKRSPLAAKLLTGGGALGLGYVGLKGVQATFGILSGATALKGSAAALTQSAAALDGAAARLGLTPTGPVSKIPTNIERRGARTVMKAAARDGLKAAALAGTLLAIDDAVYGNLSPEQKARIKAQADRINAIKPAGRFSRTETLRRAFDAERTLLGLPTTIGAERLDAQNAKPFTIAGIRAALGGDAAFRSELSGHAEVTVKVTAGDGLRAEIESVVNHIVNYLNINGTPASGTAGSIGRAMPEAMPLGVP